MLGSWTRVRTRGLTEPLAQPNVYRQGSTIVVQCTEMLCNRRFKHARAQDAFSAWWCHMYEAHKHVLHSGVTWDMEVRNG
jgi:hypothetical protein